MTHEDRNEGEALRELVIELRNEALAQADFKWAVNLSHVIKWMADRLNEDQAAKEAVVPFGHEGKSA